MKKVISLIALGLVLGLASNAVFAKERPPALFDPSKSAQPKDFAPPSEPVEPKSPIGSKGTKGNKSR
jgi:hypothetical protein